MVATLSTPDQSSHIDESLVSFTHQCGSGWNLGGNAVCWFNVLLFLDMVRDVYIRFLPLIREFKQRRFRVKSQGEVDF